MQKIDRLLASLKRDAVTDDYKKLQEIEKVMGKLSTDQLKELVYGEPSQERIEAIFASVDGLNLLESW